MCKEPVEKRKRGGIERQLPPSICSDLFWSKLSAFLSSGVQCVLSFSEKLPYKLKVKGRS